MSEPFNVLLLDPTREQLLGCLARASHGGDASHWAAVPDDIAEHPDGRIQLEHIAGGESGGALVVFWWTDCRGGKEVRIATADISDPQARLHASQLDQDMRPPIWHIAPERIYHVSRRDRPDVWL